MLLRLVKILVMHREAGRSVREGQVRQPMITFVFILETYGFFVFVCMFQKTLCNDVYRGINKINNNFEAFPFNTICAEILTTVS